jgi:hypothetical protein
MLTHRSIFDEDGPEGKKQKETARKKALELLKSPKFFSMFLEDIKKAGLIGEKRNALALYIVSTSRFRERPVNALIKGKSSAGKNFLVRMVTENFMPEKTVHGVSSMSERSLNFVDKDDLRNSILYLYEVDGSARSGQPTRLLISEGKLVHWHVKSSKWGKEVREEVTSGPVSCISTTTEHSLKIDDESRHLSLWIDESPEQTKRIAKAYVAGTQEKLTLEMKQVWMEVQSLLNERKDLPIGTPKWFEGLVDQISVSDVRIRRYFPAFVESCKTVCLIRSFGSTKAEVEKHGGMMVSFEDFAITAMILDKVVADSLNRAAGDDEIWTAELVDRLSDQPGGGQGIEASNLVGEPGITSLDKAYRLLRRAEHAGTIFRANPTGKNNEKLYLPTAELGFIGKPQLVFSRLGIPGTVKFMHPTKAEWVTYGQKQK